MKADSKKQLSLYEYAGGWDALHKHVTIFYHSCLQDALLQPLFGTKEEPGHIDKFTAFTAETLGDPTDLPKKWAALGT